MSIATTSAVMWPASFWRAMDRRLCGVDTSRSRLPLAASPASVPERASTDHSPSRTGRTLPTRQEMKPPSVSMLIGSPSRPRKTAGRAVIEVTRTWRFWSVSNSAAMGAAVASMNSPPIRPTTSAARRLSRSVLA